MEKNSTLAAAMAGVAAAGPKAPPARRPRFVMCPPRYLSTRIPNNVWMKGAKVNVERALKQFARIKNVITSLGVEVLEIPPVKGCQDQTYVANIGITIRPDVILANYKAPGRDCEIAPAREFFQGLGYHCTQPPYHFEGEADLKKLKPNVYFGGWGQFTDIRALDWIASKYRVQIVPIKEINPKVYHLDCSILVVDEQNVLVTKEGIDKPSLKAIEKLANVTITPPEIAITGVTNAVLIPEKKICLSGTFNPEMPNYRQAMEWMNATFDKFGYTCVFLDTDEADKSGADLSCMVMHLEF